MSARSPAQGQIFDRLKLVVAAILLIIIILLLWRCSPTGRTAAPAPTPIAQVAAPPTPAPAATATPEPTPEPTPAVGAPTLDLPDGALKAGKVTLSGTGTPGSKVRVIVDGQEAGTAEVGPDGRWSLPVEFDGPGQRRVQLEAVDDSGTVLAASEPKSLDVAPAFVPLAVQVPDRGTLLPPGEEPATTRLTLSGTGEPGATVEVWAGDQLLGTTRVGSDGTWTFDQEVALAAGHHDVVVRMLDADGNVLGASDPFRVEVAEPTVAAPTVRLQADGDELILEGTGAPGSRLQIVIDGQVVETVTVGEDGSWSAVIGLAPGDHEVNVQGVDASGNIVAESEPLSWTQPERAAEPGPMWTFPAAGDALRAGPVELRGTGIPGAEIEILDGDVVLGTTTVQEDGTWRFEVELSQGSRALSARYKGDGAGTSEVTMVSVVPVEEACPFVPVPAGESRCPADPPPGEDRGDTYVVAWCETIHLIAARTGVRARDLLAVNPQVCNPNLIYEGQVLKLPPRE